MHRFERTEAIIEDHPGQAVVHSIPVLVPAAIKAVRPIAIYPVVAITSHVLFAVTYSGVPIWAAFRPLAVALPIMLVMQAALEMILGRQRGSFVAAIVATFLAGAIFTCLALLCVAAIRTILKLRWPSLAPTWPSMTRSLNVVAGALLAVTLVTAWSTETFALANPDRRSGAAPPGAPNVYILMLDGYPRTDTLADWGYDNEPFLVELERMGFDISRASHSNYMKTWVSLSSMADLEHINADSFDGSLPSDSVQHRRLSKRFNEAQGWSVLRQSGYEVVATETAFVDLALYTADRTIGGWPINAFETDQLVRTSPLARLGIVEDWQVEAYRDRVIGQLEATAQVTSSQPLFVWSHVMSPHAPAIFDRNGEPRAHPCYPIECQFFQPRADQMGLPSDSLEQGLVGQVQYLNTLIEDTVRTIVTRDPTAVIVILSDHGARHESPTTEFFHNFFAARTPGHPELFPPDVGMVTMLAMLLNAYLDAGVPVPDGIPQFMSSDSLLNLVEWPEP